MKKFLFIFIIPLFIYGQNDNSPHGTEISFQVTQDIKLATFKDDGHYNKAFTPDFSFKVQFTDHQKEYGHYIAALKYEYADLYMHDYERWGMEVGRVFTNIPLWIDKLVNKHSDWRFNFSLLGSYGQSNRGHFKTARSLEFSSDIFVALTDKLNLVFLHTYTERPDLKKWTYNLSFGIRYDFINIGKIYSKKATRF